tara:strand:- start:668 stop:1024 length:357 start_codon:yes stop_codon:yes gene_type:complete
MKVYTKITMSQGVLDTVDVSLECPEVLDTSDEGWNNGFKVFEHEVDAPAVVAEEPETLPDTLWVYDLARFVEVHAPTGYEARAKIDRLESRTGLEFQLVKDWDIYQQEYEQQRDKGDQ